MAGGQHMKTTVATVVVGLTVAASGAWAQQQAPPVGRASLNLGVPTQAHNVPCEHEDAKAKANGWNLAFGLGVYRTCQPHVVAPEVIASVKPQYTPGAMRAKIEGHVLIAAVVGEDGKVSDARVLQSLDRAFGLDDSALAAVRKTTYTPGRLGANAVKVVVIVDQQFVLR